MSWAIAKNLNGHDMVIEEAYENGRVTALWMTCRTHEVHAQFAPPEFTKYRLALAAARDFGDDHAGDVDKAPWSLVL